MDKEQDGEEVLERERESLKEEFQGDDVPEGQAGRGVGERIEKMSRRE